MDDFLALELNRRKEFLEKIVIEKTAALAQSGPEGRLRCVDRNGRPEYILCLDAPICCFVSLLCVNYIIGGYSSQLCCRVPFVRFPT